MKKLFLLIFLCFCAAPMVYAQATFSSALGGGAGYVPARQTFYNPAAPTTHAAPAARPAARPTFKKTTIKYSPAQVSPTSAQMEKLAPFIKRIQSHKIKSLELVGITRDYNLAYHRLDALSKIIEAYDINLPIDYQYITGNAVLKSNDNTIEILEYW